jgi:hypothetical protein
MKTHDKRRGPGESEASDLERHDDIPLDHPGNPAGNHEGSPVGSRGDHRRRQTSKEVGGSRTNKK